MKKVLFLGLVLLVAVAVAYGSHVGPKRVVAEILDCENGHCEVIDVPAVMEEISLCVNGTATVKVTPDSAANFSVAYNEALDKAVTAAKEKAEKLRSAIGAANMKLVSLKEISNNFYMAYERAHFFHGDIDVSATVELCYLLSTSQKLDFGLQVDTISDTNLGLDKFDKCSHIPGGCEPLVDDKVGMTLADSSAADDEALEPKLVD